MGKSSHERRLSDTEAQAVARSLRVSPQKLNLVAGMIRGKKVEQALAELEFSQKRIAGDVRKCVMSAVANAENNHSLARGRGRGSTIIKPFSQLTVVVRQVEQEKVEKKPAKKSATKSAKPTDQKAAKKPAAKSKEAK
jgi:large subunit ribosomal protein L22